VTIDAPEAVLAIFRDEAANLIQRTAAALNRADNAQGEARKKQIAEVCRLLHTLKGAAAAVGHDAIKQATHELEDRVGERAEAGDAARLADLFDAVEAIEELVSQNSALAVEAAPVAPAPTPAAPVSLGRAPIASADRATDQRATLAHDGAESEATPAFAEWLRVPPERLDQLHAHVGELVLARLQQDELVDRMIHLRSAVAQAMARQRELTRALTELRSELGPDSWRRLKLSTQGVTSRWGALLGNLQTICRDARVLQAQASVVGQGVEESIRDLRLMPLTPFFEGFAKSAREAARSADKFVRFYVRADGAEVDRSVLTRLHDALLHLVRNAVVHGIESPAERARAGKTIEGTLTLEAWSAGTSAVVRVIDDGAGIDVERVRKKAAALGLPDADDVLELLTHPGFSTRDSADELAGRGVGLDVVANIVRGLEGTLELSSEPGRGAAFTLRVPIAASTTMGLILEVGKQQFGIMLNSVERVIRPSPEEIIRVEGRPALKLDGEVVGLVALGDLLGIDEDLSEQSHIPVVVLKHARRRLAVAVSEIPGEHPLVVKPFAQAFRGIDLFVGGAVQPDHSIVPVLGVAAVFARAARSGMAVLTHATRVDRARKPSNLHALVVDDSITMRTMLRNVLSAAGYQVVVAEDGKAALSVLDTMPECHVVITDLQMPELDGIGLCRSIRAREGRYVPIMMVTSVDDDDEKSRALAAGADAYAVKSTFEQSAFLARVDTLVRGPARGAEG